MSLDSQKITSINSGKCSANDKFSTKFIDHEKECARKEGEEHAARITYDHDKLAIRDSDSELLH